MTLEERLQKFKDSTTPEELSYTIWSKHLEEATGSNKRLYREGLVNWIFSYCNKRVPIWKSYKTPMELAEGVWSPYLDEPDDHWFPALRNELVEWIENYKAKQNEG